MQQLSVINCDPQLSPRPRPSNVRVCAPLRPASCSRWRPAALPSPASTWPPLLLPAPLSARTLLLCPLHPGPWRGSSPGSRVFSISSPEQPTLLPTSCPRTRSLPTYSCIVSLSCSKWTISLPFSRWSFSLSSSKWIVSLPSYSWIVSLPPSKWTIFWASVLPYTPLPSCRWLYSVSVDLSWSLSLPSSRWWILSLSPS